MSEAPERIWIEDEFGDGDDDQWTYGTWDVRNYAGYDVEYIRADIVQALTAERDRLREALGRIAKSEPRPKRSGDYDRADVSALQRIARTALKGETP